MPVKIKSGDQDADVPAAVAQEAVLSGSAKLREGKVHVRKGLQTGTVDAADLDTAVGQGWELVDPERVADLTLRREETDLVSQAQGGVEAALAGATVGLSDLAAVELFGADAARMQARREGLGGVGTGLEIAGALAPLLLSGGTAAPAVGGRTAAGLAARAGSLGLRTLGAPTRAVEALGIGAEGLAARGLARLGAAEGGLARTVVPIGARGATEGLAYGIGDEISEATLGGREITAEHLAAAGGMGLALGLGGGVAFGGLGKIAVGASRAPKEAMSRVLARMADGTVDSTHPVAKVLGGVWGMAPDDVVRGWQKFKSGEMADYFYRADDMAEKIRGSVHTEVNGFKSALDDAIKLTSGERKMRRLHAMIPDSSDTRAPWRLRDDLEDLGAKLDAAIEENAFAQGGAYEYSALKEAQKVLGQARAEIGKARTGVESFRIAEKAKQQLGTYSRKLAEMNARAPTPRLQSSLDLLEGEAGIGGTLRGFLTDERLFGAAASAQKAIAGADATALKMIRQNSKGGGPLAKILRRDADFNSRDAMLFVKRWGRAGSESLEEATDSTFKAQLHALQQRLDHYDLTPAERAAIKKATKHYESLQTTLEQQRKNVDTYDLAQRFRNAEGQGSPSITTLSTVGPTLGALAGSTFGPVGALLGHVAGGVTRPYTMLRTLSGIHDIASKAGLRIDAAVERFVGGFGQKVKQLPQRTLPQPKASRGLVRKAATRTAIGALSGEERSRKLDEVRERAQILASSPAALQEALADAAYELDQAAPGVAAAMQGVTQRGAAYLAANAPKAYEQPWSGRPPVVSYVEAAAFARRVEATVHPIETLEERLAEGTLAPEHVEALEEVWPQIFDGVRTSIGNAVVQAQVSGVAIPARQRTILGRLFRVPIGPGADVTLEAQQAVYGPVDPGQQQQPPPESSPEQKPRNVDYDTGIAGVYTAGSRADRGLKG